MTEEEWLRDVRGLDLENLSRNGVEWRNGKVGIPYVENSNLIGFKVRDVANKSGMRWDRKGVKATLWNVDVLADESLKSQPVIIAEGEFDALAIIQAGFPRTLSVAHGAQNVGGIIAHADRIKQSPCVIIAGDADEAGTAFVRAAANALEGHPTRFVEYPDGCKDANDVVAKFHGTKELAEAINAARPIFPEDPKGGLITGFSDAPPAPDGNIYRTGDRSADSVICWHVGFPTIITGVPASGKSTWLTWALWNAGRNHRLRNAVSLLETPWPVLRDHLCRLETQMAYDELGKAQREAIDARLDENWRVLHRIDDGYKHDLAWLREMMWAAAVRDGCKIITFDPWNEIDHAREASMNETEYTNAALAAVRKWAERYDCAVNIVAHPTKMQREPGRPPYPPLGYDIGGSAAWYNKAAVGVTVHRERDDHGEFTRVINWKSKFQHLYRIKPCSASMLFDPVLMSFSKRLEMAQ